VYTVAGTWLLLTLVNALLASRATSRDEASGLDVSQHGEEGYTDGEGAILVLAADRALAPTMEHGAMRRTGEAA